MEFDYEIGTVALAQKTLIKLIEMPILGVITWSQFMSNIGILFYAAQVLNKSVAPFYYAFKMYRKYAARYAKGLIQDDDRVFLWQSALRDMNNWRDTVVDSTSRSTKKEEKAGDIFVDASQVGFAIIICTSSECKVFSSTWWKQRFWKDPTYRPAISHLENYVAWEAARILHTMGKHRSPFFLHIDNTSAQATQEKRRSP